MDMGALLEADKARNWSATNTLDTTLASRPIKSVTPIYFLCQYAFDDRFLPLVGFVGSMPHGMVSSHTPRHSNSKQ